MGVCLCLGLLAACGKNKQTVKTTSTAASAVIKDSSIATKSTSVQTSVSQQPIERAVHKNPVHTAVFPYTVSVSMDYESITLSFSTDGTMVGTIIVTYQANHDGAITFYKNPNQCPCQPTTIKMWRG